MADNTTIAAQTGGDQIRGLARLAGAVKTQVMQLDLGGPSANAEVLLVAGQQVKAASMPVTIASDQPAVPVSGTFWQTTQPVSLAASVAVTGTFFQATQPVSGTFFQSTQPIVIEAGANTTASVSVSPTVTASSAYTAGNQVGGLLTFANAVGSALGGLIESVTVRAKSVQTAGLKLYVFSADPTNSTWTDKSAPSINAADLPSLLGVYTLGAADSGLGTMTVWNLDGVNKLFKSATTSLYGVLVTTGTPTFTSTSDISVTVTSIID